MLGEIPEIRFGTQEYGAFSSEQATQVIADWANGAGLRDIAERYGGRSHPSRARLADFATYLAGHLSQPASWDDGNRLPRRRRGRTGIGAVRAVHGLLRHGKRVCGLDADGACPGSWPRAPGAL